MEQSKNRAPENRPSSPIEETQEPMDLVGGGGAEDDVQEDNTSFHVSQRICAADQLPPPLSLSLSLSLTV